MFDVMMREAISEARLALPADVPIGAVISTASGLVVAQSHNETKTRRNVLGHAELMVLQELDDTFLRDHSSTLTMFVTLEPCPMCAWAIRKAGLGGLVFGAYNSDYGAGGSVFDLLRDPRAPYRAVETLGGVLERECGQLLGDFFNTMR